MTTKHMVIADTGLNLRYTMEGGCATSLCITDMKGALLWSAAVATRKWQAQYGQRVKDCLHCIDGRAVVAYVEEGASGRVVYAAALSNLISGQALDPVESRSFKAAVAAKLGRGFATMLAERTAVPQPIEVVELTYRRTAIKVGVYAGARHVYLLTALGICPVGSMVAFKGAEEGTYNLRRAYTFAVLANGLKPRPVPTSESSMEELPLAA